ncbi:hypothetical protein SuUB23_17400 [Streptococcus uberis]
MSIVAREMTCLGMKKILFSRCLICKETVFPLPFNLSNKKSKRVQLGNYHTIMIGYYCYGKQLCEEKADDIERLLMNELRNIHV